MEDVIRTAGILCIENKKVLLVRHSEKAQHTTNAYGIPAGQIRVNEKAIETALRKFHEESGLITSKEKLTKLSPIYTAEIERKNGMKHFSLEVFLCRSYTGEIRLTDTEIPEWIKIEDLEKIKLLPNMRRIIEDGMGVL